MYWFLKEGSGPEKAGLALAKAAGRRAFGPVLEGLSFLTSVIDINLGAGLWHRLAHVLVEAQAVFGGRGPLLGTVRCSYTDCRQDDAGYFEGGKRPRL